MSMARALEEKVQTQSLGYNLVGSERSLAQDLVRRERSLLHDLV